ncbi:MAG: ABC transporter permease [Chloroflexota bacterium]
MAKGMDRLDTMPVSPRAKLTRRLLRLWAVVIIAYLYLPIVFLIMFSFEDSKSVGFPIPGWTLKWYQGLPENGPLLGAIWQSVSTSAVVAVLATIVGTMAAFPLVRSGMRWPNVARILFTMPIMMPGLIIGIGILIFLSNYLHIPLSQFTVIAGHLVLTMPFVVLIVSARLQGFDRRLEWAAADLGASPAQVMRRIVLPLIFPAILAGALISITLSIDEFVVTFWTVGPKRTSAHLHLHADQVRRHARGQRRGDARARVLGADPGPRVGIALAFEVRRSRRSGRLPTRPPPGRRAPSPRSSPHRQRPDPRAVHRRHASACMTCHNARAPQP